MKGIIMITSKNLFRISPILLSMVISSNMHGIMVSRNNLTSRVREEAQAYLSSQGHQSYSIPARIQSEYNQKIDDATQRLYNRLDYEGRSYADSQEIKNAVRDVMAAFITNTLNTLVLRHKLHDETRNIIYKAAQQEGINPNNIPASMTTEYNSRTNNVIDNLRRIMSNDGRDYVRVHEVETEIKKEMKALFARIKREQQSSYNASWASSSNNSHTSWNWSDFFGSSNSNSNSSSYGSSNNVSSYQLDNKVAELADEVLREKDYSEATIPSRLVSDYADKVQAVIRQMRKKMRDWNSTSVTVSDIKSALINQLQPIFDALTYKGESCSICLDDYAKQDRVGYLTCGHFFHTDCIQNWLEQKNSCPLCRAAAYGLQNSEIVQ